MMTQLLYQQSWYKIHRICIWAQHWKSTDELLPLSRPRWVLVFVHRLMPKICATQDIVNCAPYQTPIKSGVPWSVLPAAFMEGLMACCWAMFTFHWKPWRLTLAQCSVLHSLSGNLWGLCKLLDESEKSKSSHSSLGFCSIPFMSLSLRALTQAVTCGIAGVLKVKAKLVQLVRCVFGASCQNFTHSKSGRDLPPQKTLKSCSIPF